jgi:hypothetical protein
VQRIDGRDSRVNVDALDVDVALVRRLIHEDVKDSALKNKQILYLGLRNITNSLLIQNNVRISKIASIIETIRWL